jgi:hypothetical protein
MNKGRIFGILSLLALIAIAAFLIQQSLSIAIPIPTPRVSGKPFQDPFDGIGST